MKNIDKLLEKNEIALLQLRYKDKFSTTKVSRQLNLDRASINKIEKEAISILEIFLLSSDKFNNLFDENTYLNKSVLANYLEGDLVIAIIEENKMEDIYYSDIWKRIYLKNLTYYKDRDKEVRRLLRKIDDYGYIDDLYMQLAYLEDMTRSDLDLLKKNINLKEIGDYYFLGENKETNILSMILKKEYKDGFILDPSNLRILGKRYEELTGIGLTCETCYQLEDLFSKNKTIYQVYERKYYYYGYFPINEEDLEIIKNVIYKKWYGLEEKAHVEAKDAFKAISLKTSRIKSVYHLVDIINYNLYEHYFIRPGDLNIFRRRRSPVSNEETIYRMILKENKPLKTKEICERLRIRNKNIDYSLRGSSRLTRIGNKIYLVDEIEKNYSKEEIYKKFIEEGFEEGFSTGDLLFNKITFDPVYNDYFNEKSIKTSKELTDYILKKSNYIVGNISYLYKKDFQAQSLDDLIPLIFTDKVTRFDIYNYIEELMLPRHTARRLMKNMDKYYYQVGKEEYINKENFFIEEDLVTHVLDLIPDEDYISLSKILVESPIKPSWTKHELNQFLLANILENKGYKKLDRNNEQYINEEIVLVKKNSPFESIDELVCDLLINDYEGRKIESDIYDYLVKKGIYEFKEYEGDKKLRRDLTYKGLITVDYAGRVYYGD